MTVAVARDYVHVAGELRPDLGQLWPPMPVDMEYGLASVRSVNGDSEACLCEAMEVDTKSPKVIDLKARLEKVSQTTTVEPSMELAQPTREATYVRTDLGNTNYFIEHHKDDFRFDHTRNQWLVWREHRWEPDALTRVVDAVQTDAETRLRRAVLGIDPQEDFDTRDKYVKWLLQSQQRSRIDAVVHLAKSREAIAVATAQGWDANPWLLGAPNGVVDLRTGEFRPGRQNDHITKHLGARFDSQATCPRFLEFLEEVFDGDKALVTFVRRAFGYTMTGSVSEDCWFGCYGSGRNGKSTLLKLFHALLGDYSYAASFSMVTRGYNTEGKRDFDIAYLQGKRFVMASETKEGGAWDEERLKRLTGRDPLHGEYKYGAEFNFLPSHKLWFMFNYPPRSQDHSEGFWRRVRVIPFRRQFAATADKSLDEKLLAEREGILAWAVRAAGEYLADGLPMPEAVNEASRQYEKSEDPILEFVQRYVHGTGPGFRLRDVYGLYRDWCKDEHIDRPLGKGRFSQLLERKGFEREETPLGPRFKPGRLQNTFGVKSEGA